MIITIDGAVATGKSTVAKKLALARGYIYFDTGAMYRAVTWAVLQNKVPLDDPAKLKAFLDSFDLDMKIKQGEKSYFVSGVDVTDAIRGEEVTNYVSAVAAVPEVREKLTAIQRELAQGVNAVFEGRDAGTVVFPNADLKIFLTGDPKVRAERRYKELSTKFPDMAATLTVEKVLEDITRRDTLDSTRAISPLTQAEDCHVIDTTGLTPDEVVYRILECKDQRKRQ